MFFLSFFNLSSILCAKEKKHYYYFKNVCFSVIKKNLFVKNTSACTVAFIIGI